MEKPVITQKRVLKIIQICVAVTQRFPKKAQFQNKSDYEHKKNTDKFFIAQIILFIHKKSKNMKQTIQI
jgi:hypothetical protein